MEYSSRTVCPSCKQEIDEAVCWCGDAIAAHEPYWCTHSPVPMGCVCHFPDKDKTVEKNDD